MDNKVLRQYTIANRKFFLTLSLWQDEILAPIVLDMYRELPNVLSRSSKNLIALAGNYESNEEEVNSAVDTAVAIAIDLQSIKAWILAKRKARIFLSVLLVEDGKEFLESDLAEKEIFFAKHAPAYVTDDVISFFLSSSSLFGKNTQTSSPLPESGSTQTTP